MGPTANTADQIYRLHSGFVWRVLRARGIPTANLPDVLQEIFVTVLRQLSKYQERESLKGWLYTITDGHIKQFFRGEGRRARRMALFAFTSCGHTAGDDLDDRLSRGEATQLVQRFIDELPESLREIFLLRWVEGISGVEVAGRLNININTFYSREAAARRRFGAFIERAHTREGAAP